MGIDIVKRVRDKFGRFMRKGGKNKNAKRGSEFDTKPICGNCKYFQHIGYNGVVGVCTHEKALHRAIANKLNTYGKPTARGCYLTVMPHFHCGMRLYTAK